MNTRHAWSPLVWLHTVLALCELHRNDRTRLTESATTILKPTATFSHSSMTPDRAMIQATETTMSKDLSNLKKMTLSYTSTMIIIPARPRIGRMKTATETQGRRCHKTPPRKRLTLRGTAQTDGDSEKESRISTGFAGPRPDKEISD